MNFEDRLTLEYMINPKLYQKYQKIQRQTQHQEFYEKKKKHKQEIEEIIKQLLHDETKDTPSSLLISPKVLHAFEEFTRKCIEDIEEQAIASAKMEKSSTSSCFDDDGDNDDDCHDNDCDDNDGEDGDICIDGSEFCINDANFDEHGYCSDGDNVISTKCVIDVEEEDPFKML